MPGLSRQPTSKAIATAAAAPDALHVPVAAVVLNLKQNGISCEVEDNPAAHALLIKMQEHSRSPGFLSVRSVMVEKLENNIVMRSLLCSLAVPDFGTFVRTLEVIFNQAKVGGGWRVAGVVLMKSVVMHGPARPLHPPP